MSWTNNYVHHCKVQYFARNSCDVGRDRRFFFTKNPFIISYHKNGCLLRKWVENGYPCYIHWPTLVYQINVQGLINVKCGKISDINKRAGPNKRKGVKILKCQ